jgi:acyl-CoA synthetase (AMP-forming)/AMP-acid ligase II
VNIAMLLELPASIAPDQAILRDGSRSATYADLVRGAGRACAVLDDLGVGRGDRIGIFAVNSIPLVELLLAAAARGAIAVPMNFRAKENETAHLLADSQARIVFCDPRYVELIERVRPPTVERIVVLGEEYDALRRAAPPAFEVSFEVDDPDVAILIYTSGTTALPKGVPLTHGGLSAFVLGRADVTDGTERGRTLLSVPLYHVAGLSTLLVSLYAGRTVVLLPQFEAGDWLETVEREQVTHAFLVPTMLAKLLADERLAQHDLSSLRSVSYGAAPMPQSVISAAIARLPGVDFSGAYGMSETTSTVCVLSEEDHRRAAEGTDQQAVERLASVGRAIEGVELSVRSTTGDVCAPGDVGEVFVRTGRTMRSYWRRDDDSGKGSTDADGWLSTGDLGYLDADGYLFLVGRNTDMIIRGGENIAPSEIEEALYRHPDIAEVGVVGLPDEEWGEVVVAAVVPRDNAELSEDALRAHCADLATFKRPSRILVLPELPRTSTGKLVRRELVDICRQLSPDPSPAG